MKVGFFDSGVGGLTILSSVRARLPEYDYLYYGDTAHVPYGDKSEEEIYTLTSAAVRYLFDHGAQLVIIACNTASAETTRRLQETELTGAYADRKILGVIIPTIEILIESNPHIALLVGTERTIQSKKYEIELKKLSSQIDLRTEAIPKLVPLIESLNLDAAWDVLKEVLDRKGQGIDTLILGCTHYTLLKDRIRDTYNFAVISQDEIIPEKVFLYLQRHPEIAEKLSHGKTMEIVLSADTPHYEQIKQTLLAV